MIVIAGAALDNSNPGSAVYALQFNRSGGASSWSNITPQGTQISSRASHSAIYDPAGNRVIVFGGSYDGLHGLNDSWQLQLSGAVQWSQLATGGTPPTPRFGQTAIYDPVRSRMVVVGGYPEMATPGVGVKAWSLSLPSTGTPQWQLKSINSPPIPRRYHEGIYDAAQDRVVFFGGFQESFNFPCGDYYTWSLYFGMGDPPWDMSWGYYIPSNTPPVRYGHVTVYDPEPPNNRLIMFGGSKDLSGSCDGGITNETYQLSLERYLGIATWTKLSSSAASRFAALGLDGGARVTTAPNPSSGAIDVRFRLSRSERVSISLFDVRGRLVRELRTGAAGPGPTTIRWDGLGSDGHRVSAGLYYFLVRSESFTERKPVIVMH